jgi:O-antigen/teichoic acid export membrane protein
MILQVLLSLDLWLLKSLWSGPAEVIGFYVAALNVARLPTVVPSVLSGVLFTSLTWALARADKALAQRYLQAAGRFALIVLFPSCALVAVDAEPIMALLYSDTYATGGMYLRLQITAFGLMAFLDAFLLGLMAIDKHFQSVGILLALVPVALLFNVVLIPQYGALGAAASLACTMLCGTAVAAFLTYRQYRVLLSPLTVFRVMAATAGIILFGMKIDLTGPWLLVKLPLLLMVYVALLSLLQELSWKDLHPFALWERA